MKVLGYACEGYTICLDCADSEDEEDGQPIFDIDGEWSPDGCTCDTCFGYIIEPVRLSDNFPPLLAGNIFVPGEADVVEFDVKNIGGEVFLFTEEPLYVGVENEKGSFEIHKVKTIVDENRVIHEATKWRH